MNQVKKVTILIRTAPYGMASAGEGFRAIIGLAGMGVETHVVLADDGALIALKGQDPTVLNMHNLEEVYAQVPDFGARLYVHEPSLVERGLLKDDCIDVESITDDGLAALISAADHVITFN